MSFKMLPKLLPLTRFAVRRVPQMTAVRCMGGHAANLPSKREVAKMTLTDIDSLPQPEGSFQEGYAKQQQKYNILLAVNLVAFFITHYLMVSHDAAWKTITTLDYKKVQVDWNEPDLPNVEIEED